MKKEEYIKHLETLCDDDLYILARKYIGYHLSGFHNFNTKLDAVFNECKKRRTNIYERALLNAEDSIEINSYQVSNE